MLKQGKNSSMYQIMLKRGKNSRMYQMILKRGKNSNTGMYQMMLKRDKNSSMYQMMQKRGENSSIYSILLKFFYCIYMYNLQCIICTQSRGAKMHKNRNDCAKHNIIKYDIKKKNKYKLFMQTCMDIQVHVTGIS